MLNKDWVEGNYNRTENRAYLWLLPKWKPGDEKTSDLTRSIVFNIAYNKSFDQTFYKKFGKML